MKSAITVTVLGCGGSDGVPLIGGDDGRGAWGKCDPAEPRNRRTRASVHLDGDGTHLLIDLSPDLRQQLLDNGIGHVDAVLVTHEHADHTHGLHELRRLASVAGHPIPIYTDRQTSRAMRTRFAYAFDGVGGYPPIATIAEISAGTPFSVGPMTVMPFEQDHGFENTSLGFRIGGFAYSTDVVTLPAAALDALKGVDTWMVDCVQEAPHPTHANLETALGWIRRMQPQQAVLTHMGPQLDYRALADKLPDNVVPAHDGLVLTVSGF